jgi:hypothetical protein
MSNRTTTGGMASRFAHLAGFRRAAKPRSDESPATQDDVTDVKEDVEELEEKVEDLEEQVEGEDEPADEEADAPAEPDPKTKPAESKAFRNGRKAGAKAERTRCGAIFGAKAAGLNPTLAASLAFESDLPVKQALAILSAGTAGMAAAASAQPPAKPGLAARMQGEKPINLSVDGGSADRTTAAGNAAFILGAGKAPKQ